MSAPETAFQAAVVAALKSDAALIAEYGGTPRVYDRFPAQESRAYPDIGISEVQVVDLEDDCHLMSEVFQTTHIWSRAIGQVEAKRIGGIVRVALNRPFAIDGFRIVSWQFVNAQYMPDPDELTTHGIVQHRYELEPTA